MFGHGSTGKWMFVSKMVFCLNFSTGQQHPLCARASAVEQEEEQKMISAPAPEPPMEEELGKNIITKRFYAMGPCPLRHGQTKNGAQFGLPPNSFHTDGLRGIFEFL